MRVSASVEKLVITSQKKGKSMTAAIGISTRCQALGRRRRSAFSSRCSAAGSAVMAVAGVTSLPSAYDR